MTTPESPAANGNEMQGAAAMLRQLLIMSGTPRDPQSQEITVQVTPHAVAIRIDDVWEPSFVVTIQGAAPGASPLLQEQLKKLGFVVWPMMPNHARFVPTARQKIIEDQGQRFRMARPNSDHVNAVQYLNAFARDEFGKVDYTHHAMQTLVEDIRNGLIFSNVGGQFSWPPTDSPLPTKEDFCNFLSAIGVDSEIYTFSTQENPPRIHLKFHGTRLSTPESAGAAEAVGNTLRTYGFKVDQRRAMQEHVISLHGNVAKTLKRLLLNAQGDMDLTSPVIQQMRDELRNFLLPAAAEMPPQRIRDGYVEAIPADQVASAANTAPGTLILDWEEMRKRVRGKGSQDFPATGPSRSA